MAGRKTPVMQQHADAKRAYPDAIVFFRLGDFYEMFGDDALVAAKALDLTLTSRNKGKPDEIPMAGVPHHAAHGYIGRLLELGHKVAICEQMADPATVRGIVPRQVVRVITPALTTDRDQLDASSNSFLAAVDIGETIGLALLDLSTAELFATEIGDSSLLLAELCRASPKEVLLNFAVDEPLGHTIAQLLPQAALRADEQSIGEAAEKVLGDLENQARQLGAAARRASARALRFARQCTLEAELPIRRVALWEPSTTLQIDPTAQAHLELVASASGQRSTTLLFNLDVTRTPPGARLLRRRLLSPLIDVRRIRRRHDLVEHFLVHARLREELREELGAVGDLERLSVRCALGEATPRDLGALRDGLQAAGRAVSKLLEYDDHDLLSVLRVISDPVDTVEDLADRLRDALVERPPAQLKEHGVFRSEFDSALDEFDELRKHGTERMVALEAKLRDETGIGNLKLRFTRVFGWYVEVTRTGLARVPASWRRKQTVASGERYTFDELDALADKIASAEEQHREREIELFRELGRTAAEHSERVRQLSARLSRWDVAAALAEVAHRHDYCRPQVDGSGVLEVHDGRHPVVERMSAHGRFVPNDVMLDLDGARFWIVTGPNMAGKSTFLRQTALAVILAQTGSFVPAQKARIGVVDRVLSRVGASDNVAGGESTFMVEMRETAGILQKATQRSLVILDEIGRGTSTFDGLAIAWAVAEHLDNVVGCRALFATHYHELTALADDNEHVENYSVSARELRDDVVFLHRLVSGPASRSYGIAVAKLAGLPESVLARARALLSSFESGRQARRIPTLATRDQLDLFAERDDPKLPQTSQEILFTLRELDVNRLSPLEALHLLDQLKRKL